MPGLTGLRGLAALAVFGLHAWYLSGKQDPVAASMLLPQAMRWLFSIGWIGVDVFFTLSGFLLALPFLRRDRPAPATGAFLWRRWRRIFPAYYAQILLLFALLALWPELARQFRQAPVGGELLAHGLLWFFAWPAVQPWMAVWWTLPVEFGFYLCLPWLARLLRPGQWRWLLVLIVLAWGWRLAWLSWGEAGLFNVYRVNQLPGRLDQFLIGMLAAMAWVQQDALRRWLMRHRPWLLPISFAALLVLPAMWLLVHPTPHDVPSAHPLLLPWHSLASVAVVGLLWSASVRPGWLAAAPLQAVGRLSYGLYLWHLPVLMLMRGWLREPGVQYPAFWLFAGLSLALSLLLAGLSYVLIERPCLRRGLG